MRVKLNPTIDYIQRALAHSEVSKATLWQRAINVAAVRRRKTGADPTDEEFSTAYFGAFPLTGYQIDVRDGRLVLAPRGLS